MAANMFLVERINRRLIRRERVFRDRTQVLETYTDMELINKYRFPRQELLRLVDEVGESVGPLTNRSRSIPTVTKVLVTLRYLAKGDFLSEVADIHGISRSSASRCIHNCTRAINTRLLKEISTEEDVAVTKKNFYQMAKFPNTVGAIDGTLIPILAPVNNEPDFVCRKGYHAINVQAVCDSKMRFTNLVCKWPGSVHDSFILTNSSLMDTMSEKENGSGWLLGDSGYPLKPWLMTPLLSPNTDQEQRYNKAHAKTRVVIERAFGVLKSRFRCLHKTGGCLPFIPSRCVQVITCCFILHNLCIDGGIPLDDDSVVPLQNGEIDEDNIPHNVQRNGDGHIIRNRIIQRF